MRLFGRKEDTALDGAKARKQAIEAQDSALRFLQGRLLGQSEGELRRAIGLDPQLVSAYAYLGLVLLRLGRAEEARETLETALGLDGRDEGLYRGYGTVLESLSDPVGAMGAYEQAIRLQPRNPSALAALGSLQLRSGSPELALKTLLAAVREEPRDPAAFADLGLAYAAQKASAEAIGHTRTALALLTDRNHPVLVREGAIPGPADAHDVLLRRVQHQLGLQLEAQGDLNAAQAALCLAAEIGTLDLEVLFDLGKLLLRGNLVTEALARYEQAEREHPEQRERLRADLAVLLDSREDQALGQQVSGPDGQAVIGSNPGDILAGLLARVQADPDNRALRRELSIAYLRSGKLAEAKEQARIVEHLQGMRGGSATKLG